MSSSAFMAGVDEQKIKARREKENSQIKRLQQPIDDILNELKKDGDWKVLSLNKLRDKYKIGGTQNYNRMVYSLQSNANIVSRPSKVTEDNRKSGEISATIPLEYKYVSKEEKEKLGFDAQVFRHIAFDRKDLVVSAFNNAIERGLLKKEDIRPVDILATLEYLYNKHATKGWIYLEPIRMAGETGISIDRLTTAVTQLQAVHLLVVTVINRETKKGNKPAAIGTITSTEESYLKRLDETQAPESITVLAEEKNKRVSRKQAAKKRLAMLEKKLPALTAIEEKTGDITEEDITTVVNQPEKQSQTAVETTAEATEIAKPQSVEPTEVKTAEPATETIEETTEITEPVNQSPASISPADTIVVPEKTNDETSIQEVDLQFEQIYSRILEQGKIQLKKSVENYVNQRTAEYQRQIKALKKTIKKNEGQITKLETRLEKSERKVRAFTKFNEMYIENTEDQLNIFMSQSLKTFEEIEKMYMFERKDPKRMGKINRILFNLIHNTVDNISNFKPNNYPPALKK